MLRFWLRDVDVRDGALRVLYATSPGQDQGARPDAAYNIYVVRVSPSGEPTQHRIYSGLSEDYGALTALFLRPGHPEVFVPVGQPGAGAGARLLRLAIPSGEVVSDAELAPAPVPGGERWNWGTMRGTTSDGNAFYATAQSLQEDDVPVGVSAWLKASPDGDVLGRGTYRVANARMRHRAWFATDGGGLGLLVYVTAEGVDALRDLDRPVVERSVGGRELVGNVHGALQLLVTDSDASTGEVLAAVTTDVMWTGEMSVPRDLSAEERMAQTRRQMEMMQQVETELGARRHLYLGASSIRHADPVKPTEHGYGLLVDGRGPGPAGERLEGIHFLELGADGVRRVIPLEALADELESDFVDFVAGDDDEIYLLGHFDRPAGGRLGTVLRLDARGERLDAVPVMADGDASIQPAALAGGPSGLWVVARGLNETSQKTLLWVQEVRF